MRTEDGGATELVRDVEEGEREVMREEEGESRVEMMITRREEKRKGDGERGGGRERFGGLRASKWWKRRERAGSEGEVRRGTDREGRGRAEGEGGRCPSLLLPTFARRPSCNAPTDLNPASVWWRSASGPRGSLSSSSPSPSRSNGTQAR